MDNRTLRIEPFGANVSASRAYSRAERLAAAIYLVTNHIAAEEPARKTARQLSIDLLSTILVLKDEMRSSDSRSLKGAIAIIRSLISIVRLLSASGHLSAQNSETLVEGLDEMGQFLVSAQKTSLSESIQISKNDLFEEDSYIYAKGHTQETRSTKTVRSNVVSRTPNKAAHANGEEKRARTERIVGILNSQGQLGIKDIAASLPEYSEKMIQRELKQLVSSGRVTKSGSKRWSIYALV